MVKSGWWGLSRKRLVDESTREQVFHGHPSGVDPFRERSRQQARATCRTSIGGSWDVTKMLGFCKCLFQALWRHMALILSNSFDLTGDEQLKESARVYLVAAKSRRLKESLNGSGAPPRLRSMQTFPDNIA